MRIRMVEIDGVLNRFSLHKDSSCGFDDVHYCAICNKELIRNDDIYLIINNSIMFPNVWAHKRCANNYGARITVLFIKHKWEEYKKMSEKYKAFIFYAGDYFD